MLVQGQLISKVETIIWASPGPNLTLDDLIDKMTKQGFPPLEIDRINNRIKIVYTADTIEE